MPVAERDPFGSRRDAGSPSRRCRSECYPDAKMTRRSFIIGRRCAPPELAVGSSFTDRFKTCPGLRLRSALPNFSGYSPGQARRASHEIDRRALLRRQGRAPSDRVDPRTGRPYVDRPFPTLGGSSESPLGWCEAGPVIRTYPRTSLSCFTWSAPISVRCRGDCGPGVICLLASGPPGRRSPRASHRRTR